MKRTTCINKKIVSHSLLFSLVVLIFSIVYSFTVSHIAYAQTSSDLSSFDPNGDNAGVDLPSKFPQIVEQISTDVSPEVPKAGDKVTITVEAYGTNLNTHPISWSINGVKKLEGVGKKSFTFIMGDAGKVENVDLVISPAGAPRITRRFTFNPVDVDVLWQADTYTPPFYKGKALYTPEAHLTFVALPNITNTSGSRINPSDVVYTWKVDREVQGDLSGYGVNTFDFNGPILLTPKLIQTEVYPASNPTQRGLNGITVTPTSPEGILYEDNPLYGILYNKAVPSQYTLTSPEIKFTVAPYFFSTNNKNLNISYNWNLNTASLNIPDYQNSAIFRRTDDSEGQAIVSVGLTSTNKLLQFTNAGLSIFYGEKK